MSNRLQNTTNTILIPSLVDQVLKGSPLVARMMTKPVKWTGEKIKQPIKVTKGTQGGSFSGFDSLSTTAEDNFRSLQFDSKFYNQSVALPGTELTVNMHDSQKALNLAKTSIGSAAQDMADSIAELFYGDGTGNSSKDFLGLEAIVDDGTNAATYGGLSRSTYSALNSTVTASGGALTLAKMTTLFNTISDGSQQPSVIMTTKTVHGLYESLLQPFQRIYVDTSDTRVGNFNGSAGYKALTFKGIPVLSDAKATSGVMYFLNEDYLEWRAFPKVANANPAQVPVDMIKGNDYNQVPSFGFNWTGWKAAQGNYAFVGNIIVGGELWSSNPRRHGKLTGVTSA